jgi:hypothetical protein
VPDSCGARVVLGRWAVRTGHDAGMQRVRRMAKRDFPCELVGHGGVGDGLGTSWPSRRQEGPGRRGGQWPRGGVLARQFLFHLPMFDPLKFKIFKPNSKTFE